VGAAYTALYWLHVPVALTCVPAFWVAALARKGGPTHVGVGRYFALAMRWVALSGMALAAFALPGERRDFAVVLLYLGVITFVPVHHGVRVVRTRRDPARLATPSHALLVWLPLGASAAAVGSCLLSGPGAGVLLLALSPIGVVETLLAYGYLRRRARGPRDWRAQHITFMLIAGVALHTALGVFFVNGMLGMRLPAPWNLLPWLAPTLVGVPAIFVALRRDAGLPSRVPRGRDA
jgi:hypothetical protein